MRKDLAIKPTDFTSSFLSCEKDLETILKKLFITSKPYSDELKKLLILNTKDCLDNTDPLYDSFIQNESLASLREKGYIRFEPKLLMKQHQEVKSYLIFTFDNFEPTSNPQFRDCQLYIDVICHNNYWDLGDFRVRPLKICGYIDGILNEAKLSGIGTLHFISCSQVVLNETLAGYTLIYQATHGTDDVLPSAHDWIRKNIDG